MSVLRSSASDGGGGGAALPELHRRLRWVALFGIAGFVLLVGRLWQLQIIRGDSYYDTTVRNVVRHLDLPAVRGKILDRHGTPLADNRPAFNLYATPASVTAVSHAELVRLLGLSDDEVTKLDERLAIGTKRDAHVPVLILADQGRDRAALVEQARMWLPGIEVRHEPYRYYPQGDLAAHLVGYMTQMKQTELPQLTAQGYDPSDLVGRAGLESAWENYLRGKKGVEHYAVDARNVRLDDKTAASLIEGPLVTSAVPGANLVLTIDAQLQALAEKAVAHVPAAGRRDRRSEDGQAARGREQAVVRSERDDGPPDARGRHAVAQRSTQALHRQGARCDVSAGLDLQVRDRVRRARRWPRRRGRIDLVHRRVPAVGHARSSATARTASSI